MTQPDIEQLGATLQALKAEIGKAFVGQAAVVNDLMTSLLAGGHVLLEGVPGLGKTLLVKALSRAIGGDFARVQFTPDLMPSDVSGHAVYEPATESFRIRRGPVFTNLLLADEINRAPAKTQAALLEVMQEGQVTIEGTASPLEPPFMVVATQNPVEHEGTYPLPEAQLDRFLLKVLIDYPDENHEIDIVSAATGNRVGDGLYVDDLTPVMSSEQIVAAQKTTAGITVDPVVLDYAVRITRHTREASGIRMGAGPRGTISIIRAARASAVLAGRDFVTPDDVRQVCIPALRHRIALAPELEIESYKPDDILAELLKDVDAPRQ
ncbi:MAG: MoxR family ATPase [Pseudomonadota bacterium]